MQQWLGITGWLRCPLKHQIAGSLEGNAVVARRHRHVGGVTGVLLVHDHGHTLHDIHHQLLADNAMTQPVSNVLTGNTQRSAVFHQADVVDIQHFGATHAQIHPTHHIPQRYPDSCFPSSASFSASVQLVFGANGGFRMVSTESVATDFNSS
jgi:hypothetical protein